MGLKSHPVVLLENWQERSSLSVLSARKSSYATSQQCRGFEGFSQKEQRKERKKKDQASSWPHMGQYAQTHNRSPFLCCQFLLLMILSLQFRSLLLKHKCLTVVLWTTVNSDLLNIKQLYEAGKRLQPPSAAKQHSNPQWEQRTWYFLCVCS